MMLLPVHRAVTAYLATAATPVSKYLQQCIDEGRAEDLVKTRVSPSDYTCAESYLVDAQAVAFFSKNKSIDAGIDTKTAALQKWWDAEHQCAATNAFLRRVEDGPHDQTTLGIGKFLSNVRKRMAKWLGPIPDCLYGKFGPGVTLCCRGNLSTVPDKMSTIPSTTASLLPYLKWWGESAWARALERRGLLYDEVGDYQVNLVRYGEWSSVTKNAESDRSIEIGPSLNVFHQLFVGQTMKRRFSTQGWDLRHSASLHRQVAREASISGLFATIDLSSASDTVSKVLVKLCAPEPWYQLWDDLRLKSLKLPDSKVVLLEKFSGMGNGFTFELMSCLLMSICQELMSDAGLPFTANRDVFVFGDDIIVPTSIAQGVINALETLGFSINRRKTFVDGPFRESCGGDFFNGRAVRPFYLEEDPNDPQKLISFANGLRRVALSHPHGFDGRDYLLRPWLRVLDAIPSDIRRCRGPEHFGDLVINDEKEHWQTRTKNSRRYFRVWRPVARQISTRQGGTVISWIEFWPEVQLASRLLRIGSDVGVTPRRAISGFKLGWVQYS